MSDWHVPTDLLTAYRHGTLTPAQVMSVEAHVTGCRACRATAPADDAWLAGSWARIEDVVDRPRRAPAERALARVGLPEHLARLLLATPTLSRAWLTSVVLVLAFAVGAARFADADRALLTAFLIVAPVLPLAGIAVAYGPTVDPAYELHAATPLAGARLLLVRAGAVLAPAALLTGAAAPFVGGPAALSFAWLLPGLTLSTACLAAGTRFPVPVLAGTLAAVWVAVCLLATDTYVVFSGPAQVLYGGAAALFTAVLYRRRGRLDPGEPR
ncbi:zf-HC2 domain-containing protein [Cryptosporangium japonicum]|uniref:Putative zinc-finger domain-containing protein n=1 Tax=Cryptosporangium japonicum TaxID=80872 RepID=A0ABP3E9D8_9ACTN